MQNTVKTLFFLLGIFLSTLAFAQNNFAPDTPEPGSVEAIARDTTEPRYLSSWVSYVPDSQTVPSPADYLGHIAGAANELASTKEIYGYFRELARTSKRVHVEVIGHTEEGREILLAAIADETGIANLDHLKQLTAALADPRKTSPAQAEAIFREARPMYYFNAAIHADESVSPDMSMELAYRLAVSEQPMIKNIRAKMVVLINPCANPDGRDKMVDWFHQFIKGKTDYDLLPRQSPPYWQKYVYVDANRDAHQLALATTQAVQKMFFDFHPVVIHDLHEAIPLLQTWNGTGPYNPNIDPIVLSEFLEMSFHEMSTMSGLGMPGVWTWNFGEAFGMHYTDSIAMNHNATGRGYETFGNAVPLTVTRKLDPEDVSVEWYRPSPPPEREFKWSHRDGLNYAETGCLAALDYTANQADLMLRNFYQTGFNSWQKGKAGNPYAFVIPPDQGDRRRVAQMVNRLLAQHIEVSRASADFQIKEGKYPAGSYVVRLDQPYRNYAVDLLLPQHFPNDPEHEPYDDVSWSFPVHYGVEAIPVSDSAVMKIAVQPLTADVHPAGRVAGAGAVYLLKDTGEEGLLAARYRLSKFKVQIAEEPFQSGAVSYPRGSWVISDQTGLAPVLSSASQELGLDFASAAAAPQVHMHEATLPRLGIYVPWADTDMIGWIRYTLDSENVPYTYVRDEEVRAGNLKNLVDVIVYGNVLMDLQGQIEGIERKTGPMPYKKSTQYPSLGTPAESDDITGGIGFTGLANLQKFVQDGGVFITIGRANALSLESGFVRNVRRVDLQGVTTPGAEIVAKFTQPAHPIAYGYPEITSVFRSNFSIYDPPRRWLTMSYCTSCLSGPFDSRSVILQWGTEPFASGNTPSRPILISGGGQKIDSLQGRPAILDVQQGKGHVIAYNFNPMHRDLNHSDFRFLWNAIINWSNLPQQK